MYIDFRDPEKTIHQNNTQSKPTNKKSLGVFKRVSKSSNTTLKESNTMQKVEQPSKPSKKRKSSELRSNLNILDKINQVVEEQKSDKEMNQENTKSQETTEDIKFSQMQNSISQSQKATPEIKFNDNHTPQPVPKVGKENYEPFEFRGKASEFFKIWIVNIALTLLTLGIYSAWAKVRTNRYIYGNTYLNNSNFEFNADPKRILIGRIIIVFFYGGFLLSLDYLNMYKVAAGIFVVFLLILPWLIRQAISFRLKSASYRNIPFKFHAKARSFYLLSIIGIVAIIALPSIIALSTKISPEVAGLIGFIGYILLFSVIIPILYRRYKALVVNNSSYANAKFNFNATRKEAIKVFIKMGFLTFAVSLIFGALTLAVAGMGSTLLSNLPSTITSHPMFKYFVTALTMIVYLAITGLYKGITDGYLSNFTRNHTSLDEAKFKGEIDPVTLGVISATNSLMLIFSLGLLYPYTKLRYLRYKIENTYFSCDDYDKFISQGYDSTNPIGEEAMDFFDIDIGV